MLLNREEGCGDFSAAKLRAVVGLSSLSVPILLACQGDPLPSEYSY